MIQRYQAVFDLVWQVVRDQFYDKNLGNRDWGTIRLKYRPMVSQVDRQADLAKVINLMLGELNASHLGFYPTTDHLITLGQDWSKVTAHFGLRVDPEYSGLGLKVN